jgi:hypothetical protein
MSDVETFYCLIVGSRSFSDYELFAAKCDLLLRNWGSVEPWPCRADEQQAAWAGSVMCYSITCNTRQGGATWPPRSHQ